MKNLIVGIIIGIVLILATKSALADMPTWNIPWVRHFNDNNFTVNKFMDGSVINCYVAQGYREVAMSCIKVK